MGHITVLGEEAVSGLNLKKDSVVLDCTLGAGGHASRILKILSAKGQYIGIDADPTALTQNEHLKETAKADVTLVNGNFRDIRTILESLNHTTVDAILADLGWRQEQFNGETDLPRGFSFKSDEPLFMTYGAPTDYAFTAHDIINDWAEEDIANVIYAYGEERFARRIARLIVQERKTADIATARELAELVVEAVPAVARRKRIHPATKTFQALRIAVNDEFDALKDLLNEGFALLKPGGRMAIISFHSLEDRIVKQTFKTFVHDHTGCLVNKKPLEPTFDEQNQNPRSRSAKLRIIEKQPYDQS